MGPPQPPPWYLYVTRSIQTSRPIPRIAPHRPLVAHASFDDYHFRSYWAAAVSWRDSSAEAFSRSRLADSLCQSGAAGSGALVGMQTSIGGPSPEWGASVAGKPPDRLGLQPLGCLQTHTRIHVDADNRARWTHKLLSSPLSRYCPIWSLCSFVAHCC